MIRLYNNILDWLIKACAVAACLFMAFMTVAISIEVVLRSFFKMTMQFTDEYSGYMVLATCALGAAYALISLVVAAAQAEFGSDALYPVAVVAGLTDMDAITLSSAQFVSEGRLDAGTAWRMTLIASLSNFVFKGVMVAVLGGRRLFRYLAPAFGLAVLAGLGVLFWWPADLGPHP